MGGLQRSRGMLWEWDGTSPTHPLHCSPVVSMNMNGWFMSYGTLRTDAEDFNQPHVSIDTLGVECKGGVGEVPFHTHSTPPDRWSLSMTRPHTSTLHTPSARTHFGRTQAWVP